MLTRETKSSVSIRESLSAANLKRTLAVFSGASSGSDACGTVSHIFSSNFTGDLTL